MKRARLKIPEHTLRYSTHAPEEFHEVDLKLEFSVIVHPRAHFARHGVFDDERDKSQHAIKSRDDLSVAECPLVMMDAATEKSNRMLSRHVELGELGVRFALPIFTSALIGREIGFPLLLRLFRCRQDSGDDYSEHVLQILGQFDVDFASLGLAIQGWVRRFHGLAPLCSGHSV